MRVSSIFLAAGLALFANAETATGNTAPTPSVDPAQAAVLRCLNACTPGDVNCTSRCITVPNPNEDQANATNNCVAACPQGKGTPSDTEAYSTCVQGCIKANFYNPQTGTPQPTGATSNNGGSNNNGDNKDGGSGGSGGGGGSDNKGGSGGGNNQNQASGTGTRTGTAAAATSTGAAAGGRGVVSGGLVGGLLAAVLAL